MNNEPTSFWADIKKYEEMLDKDPKSYCFVLLSELYRKLGLLEDAITSAKKGVEVHPEYVGGYMALGRACFEKGLFEESREALEKVVRATPDNILAQKFLSQLYMENGDIDSARKTLQVLVLLNPDDREGKLLLESLQPAAACDVTGETDLEFSVAHDTTSCVEKLEFPAEEVFVGEEETEELSAPEPFAQTSPRQSSGKDPLATATVAELYISQGFYDRALEVYQTLLEGDPENEELKKRCKDLWQLVTRADNDQADLMTVEPAGEIPLTEEDRDALFLDSGDSLVNEPADRIVSILEGWLENIGKVRNVNEKLAQGHS